MRWHPAAAILGLGVCAFASGCARTVVHTTQATEYDRSDVSSGLDFWHGLSTRSAITNNEGFHGLLLTLDEDAGPTAESYWDRLDRLHALGWLPEGFDEAPDLAMQRGTLAAVIAHALDIEGGVMMRLTDKHPRYANRELTYIGMLPPGTGQQVVSGRDFLGIVSRVQDYRLLKSARAKVGTEGDITPPAREQEPVGPEGEAPPAPEEEAAEPVPPGEPGSDLPPPGTGGA